MTGATIAPPAPSLGEEGRFSLELRCSLEPELARRLRELEDGAAESPGRRVVVVTGSEAVVSETVAETPDAAVIAIADRVDRVTVTKLLRAGASAVVPAGDALGALPSVVAVVLAGFSVAPRESRRALEQPLLSFREKQILGMLVMGLSNREIADRLFLTESTVKSHLTTTFGKLGVRSRKEAAALALDPAGGLSGVLGLPMARDRLDVAFAP